MAIKSMELRSELDKLNKTLEEVRAASADFEKRGAEYEAEINGMTAETSDETRSEIESKVEALEAEKKQNLDRISELEAEIERITAEIAEEETRENEIEKSRGDHKMENHEIEIRAFADYLRGIETRDDYTMVQGNNGAVVPKSIEKQIITKVKELSPIFNMATKYAVKGSLEVPYYPASADHVISAAYVDDFGTMYSSQGDISSVTLTGYTAGALAKIGKKLINNADVDIVPFIVEQMAEAFKAFYEHECIVGTSNKSTGLLAGITTVKTATYKSSVTADDLITLQCAVPTALQANCRWLMAPATFECVRKLKDSSNRYLLAPDYREGFGYTLLGKPVDLSENMPALGTTNNKAIAYGDYSGLGVKMAEALEIQVLNEQFATQHAVGVVGWTEIDTKVCNAQKFAVLKCGSSDPQ